MVANFCKNYYIPTQKSDIIYGCPLDGIINVYGPKAT